MHVPANLASSRCRGLQPPPALAAGWPTQREALLQRVAALLAGSVKGRRRHTAGGPAAAAPDADAVAAADPAMQELLVNFSHR
jgi:hypothetical protein